MPNREDMLIRIRTTRKCRILLSEHYLKKHNFYKHLSIYYAVLLLVLSMIDFMNDNFDASKHIIILSIIITSLAIYISSQNYIDKYYALKNHYIRLQNIIIKIENTPEESSLEEVNDEYLHEMNCNENHSSRQFYEYVLNNNEYVKKDKKAVDWYCKTKKEQNDMKLKLRFMKLKDMLFSLLLFLLPILSIVSLHYLEMFLIQNV